MFYQFFSYITTSIVCRVLFNFIKCQFSNVLILFELFWSVVKNVPGVEYSVFNKSSVPPADVMWWRCYVVFKSILLNWTHSDHWSAQIAFTTKHVLPITMEISVFSLILTVSHSVASRGCWSFLNCFLCTVISSVSSFSPTGCMCLAWLQDQLFLGFLVGFLFVTTETVPWPEKTYQKP